MSQEEKEFPIPVYKFVEEEGVENVTPIRRKIAKTMEITETFTFYDALAYCMKMEKAIEDKYAEIAGLQSMVDAYRKEIVEIEKQLAVEDMEKEYNLELHNKLKEEEAAKKAAEVIESPYGKEDVSGDTGSAA